GNFAKEAESPCLVAAFTAVTGERHGAFGAGAGVLDLVREQVPLAELHDAERLVIPDPCAFIGGQGLLQPGDALVGASRPRVHVTKKCCSDRRKEYEVPVAAESDRAFEQAGGLAQFSPDALEICAEQTRVDEAERVIERFRNPEGFLSVSVSLVEHSPLGE